LKGARVVLTSDGPGCTLEAQDFFDEDRKLTYSCYEPEGKASAWTLDLATGERRNETASIGFYNEPEGIFPDGEHTCVESDHQSRAYGEPASFRNIDIWKLRLDGTGRSFTRLTTFNDHEGWKASNPVVSRDGRFMAFQVARTADEAGVGYGILLLRFEQGANR
jgi:Tol biopolymer transport system component